MRQARAAMGGRTVHGALQAMLPRLPQHPTLNLLHALHRMPARSPLLPLCCRAF